VSSNDVAMILWPPFCSVCRFVASGCDVKACGRIDVSQSNTRKQSLCVRPSLVVVVYAEPVSEHYHHHNISLDHHQQQHEAKGQKKIFEARKIFERSKNETPKARFRDVTNITGKKMKERDLIVEEREPQYRYDDPSTERKSLSLQTPLLQWSPPTRTTGSPRLRR